jgi:hypothetical protein
MSELTEVGKAFVGWAEENSGLSVDENFEYTDRTVGNFAAAAFAAGAEWQAEREPTEAEIEEAAHAAFDTRDDAYDLEDWEDADSDDRERYECYVRPAFEAVAKFRKEQKR